MPTTSLSRNSFYLLLRLTYPHLASSPFVQTWLTFAPFIVTRYLLSPASHVTHNTCIWKCSQQPNGWLAGARQRRSLQCCFLTNLHLDHLERYLVICPGVISASHTERERKRERRERATERGVEFSEGNQKWVSPWWDWLHNTHNPVGVLFGAKTWQ